MQKKIITGFILITILSSISYLFYQQEIKYWVPTPVPEDHVHIEIGTEVRFAGFVPEKKKFIHFYNPNCPCSKFNFASYKQLINDYQQHFELYAVVQETAEGIRSSELDYLKKLGVKLIVDQDKEIAKKFGVYSTPQVVLMDEEDKIYYRGNYNQTRYCTNKQSSFAKMAIDSLINGKTYLFPNTAFTAYGCSLERKTD